MVKINRGSKPEVGVNTVEVGLGLDMTNLLGNKVYELPALKYQIQVYQKFDNLMNEACFLGGFFEENGFGNSLRDKVFELREIYNVVDWDACAGGLDRLTEILKTLRDTSGSKYNEMMLVKEYEYLLNDISQEMSKVDYKKLQVPLEELDEMAVKSEKEFWDMLLNK